MSCYSKYFEFSKGEAKKLEIQVNTYNSDSDCREPIGMESPVAAASRVIQDLTFTALSKLGANGNLIQVEYVGGGNAGLEVVTISGVPMYVGEEVFVGRKITVQIAIGASTANQIKAALDASDAVKLLSVAVSGSGLNTQIAQALTSLQNGTGSFVEIELPASPDNLFLTTPTVVIDNAPLSKISVELSAAETMQMIDGGMIVRVVNAGKLRVAVAASAIKQSVMPNC
jgi:energy-converting hydrogenase Eha subunit C